MPAFDPSCDARLRAEPVQRVTGLIAARDAQRLEASPYARVTLTLCPWRIAPGPPRDTALELRSVTLPELARRWRDAATIHRVVMLDAYLDTESGPDQPRGLAAGPLLLDADDPPLTAHALRHPAVTTFNDPILGTVEHDRAQATLVATPRLTRRHLTLAVHAQRPGPAPLEEALRLARGRLNHLDTLDERCQRFIATRPPSGFIPADAPAHPTGLRLFHLLLDLRVDRPNASWHADYAIGTGGCLAVQATEDRPTHWSFDEFWNP